MTVPPSVPDAVAPSFPGKRGEQDFRLAPTLLGTFGIVIAILGGYEFGLAGRLERLGIWENILTIAIGAVVAVAPVYIALRKQRTLHRYALSTLRNLRKADAERERSEKQKELQRGVTEILALGVPLSETHQKILERLCAELRWEVGALWIVDRAAKVLRCTETWYPLSTEFGRLAALNRTTTLAVGQSLPGAVWADGRAASSANVALDPRCGRRAMAAELGLRGWIGFPIMLPRQILGVAEFFSVKTQLPDEEMLVALTAIGLQIGQFIERRQLEERFRQAQKMEAVGTLSGGIAHDFNNIIGAIVGYTELAKMDVGESPQVVAHLDQVLQGAKRAAELVRQILAFSRQHEQARQPIQLRHVVTEALKLLRAMIPTSIEFEVSMAMDVPTVLADATQIHQIVMNLGTNASHAMKERVGRLTVTLENFDVGADGMETQMGLQSGHHVRLSISDTGHGMDQATLSRIFEPFFTTKAPGEGTGLGLSVVQGIMQSHEGIITAYSHPGEGTTFHLYFPVCGMEEAAMGSEVTAVPRGKGERILYVDDELPLAQMGRKILERLGYVVEIHTSAPEALEAVRARPEAYDLIITDQMMPRLTGLDLATRLQTIRPGLPIILVTGYTATLTAERVKAMGISNLLLKPISVATLGAAVHRVLAEPGARS
jgi:signal transduction histidine kinase/ActR/RegA family two-component response regulator